MPNLWKKIKGKLGTKMYPKEYFYPIKYNHRKPMKQWNIPTNPLLLQEETHMIHHFASSWYRQK